MLLSASPITAQTPSPAVRATANEPGPAGETPGSSPQALSSPQLARSSPPPVSSETPSPIRAPATPSPHRSAKESSMSSAPESTLSARQLRRQQFRNLKRREAASLTPPPLSPESAPAVATPAPDASAMTGGSPAEQLSSPTPPARTPSPTPTPEREISPHHSRSSIAAPRVSKPSLRAVAPVRENLASPVPSQTPGPPQP